MGKNHYETYKDSYYIEISISTALALNEYENIH